MVNVFLTDTAACHITDVRLVMSQSLKLSHYKTRIRSNYPCGKKSAHSACREEEKRSGDRTPTEIRQFSRCEHAISAYQCAARNRLICIGGMSLAGLDRVFFDTIIHANHHDD